MTRRFIAVLCLLAVPVILFAEWPANLQWQGVPLGYPKIAPDGHNGVFVAGSGLAFNGWDTFLFHVDSLGNSLWSPEDSACYIGPGNQYPLALYADGTGGCVMLMDDELTNFPNPSRHRVQIIRYNSEGHKVWSFVPYDTTWNNLHGIGAIAVVNGQVDIFWYSSAADSVGDWMARIQVSDGTMLDDPSIRHMGTGGIRQACENRDRLFLLARDSVFVLDPHTGSFGLYRTWNWLYSPTMFIKDDTTLIVGRTSALGTSLFVIRCLYQDITRSDTIGGNIDIGGVIFNTVPDEQRFLLCYDRNADIFGRFYSPIEGLAEELTICNAPDDQSHLRLVSGIRGLGFAWADLREGAHLYIQQYQNGSWRWPNGLSLEQVDLVPRPQFDACNGGQYGMVVNTWRSFHVQQIDSLSSGNISTQKPELTSDFYLHNPYPNPSNSSVQIQFELSRTLEISLSLFNVLGERVGSLAEGFFSPGYHTLNYENDLASGVYLLCLYGNGKTQIKKLISIK